MTKLLTPAQVAERLTCSTKHVTRLMSSGKLAYVAIGDRVRRIREEALTKFLKENECASSIKENRAGSTGASTTTPIEDELSARRNAKTAQPPDSPDSASSERLKIRPVQPKTRPQPASKPSLKTS